MFNVPDDCVGVIVRHGSREHALIALWKADPMEPQRNVPVLTVYEVAENGLPRASAQTPHLKGVTRESATGSILGVPVVAVVKRPSPAQTSLPMPAETTQEAPKAESKRKAS